MEEAAPDEPRQRVAWKLAAALAVAVVVVVAFGIGVGVGWVGGSRGYRMAPSCSRALSHADDAFQQASMSQEAANSAVAALDANDVAAAAAAASEVQAVNDHLVAAQEQFRADLGDCPS